MKVKLTFRNRTARREHELVVDESNVDEIKEWYDGFYAGDNYTVKQGKVKDNSDEINRILSEQPVNQWESAGEAQSKLNRIVALL